MNRKEVRRLECLELTTRQALALGARLQRAKCPWCCAVQDFIHRKNLEHYRRLLAGTPDEAERALLVRLLAEEEAKDPPWKNGGE